MTTKEVLIRIGSSLKRPYYFISISRMLIFSFLYVNFFLLHLAELTFLRRDNFKSKLLHIVSPNIFVSLYFVCINFSVLCYRISVLSFECLEEIRLIQLGFWNTCQTANRFHREIYLFEEELIWWLTMFEFSPWELLIRICLFVKIMHNRCIVSLFSNLCQFWHNKWNTIRLPIRI